TGLSTGPHLHYEVQYKEGKVNPANYLNRIEAYASR
ncbi:MAG: M23 family metallopeptidase, partial [Candidatus Cloacimonetes bacterium]|nr:M23 family metallopeptidase [Candidatus Cloacimonadota bacterium]